MAKKILLAMMCSMALAACGGGGDSNSNPITTNPIYPENGNDSGSGNNPDVSVSNLDKAKELVKTTNEIISYFDSFENITAEYKPIVDNIDKPVEHLSVAADTLIYLGKLALDTGNTKTFTIAELNSLLQVDNKCSIKLVGDANTPLITVDNNQIRIHGDVTIQQSYWNWSDNESDVICDTYSSFPIKIDNIVFSSPNYRQGQTENTLTIQQNGKVTSDINTKNESNFTFTENSTITVRYEDNEKLLNRGNELPKQLDINIKSLNMQTPKAKFTLGSLEINSQKVTTENGKSTIIPKKFTMKNTEISLLNKPDKLIVEEVSFNIYNDLSRIIVPDEESVNNFVNADVSVKIRGNIKAGRENPTLKPFTLNVKVERNQYMEATAKAQISVDKALLNIDAILEKINEDKVNIRNMLIKHPNGAYIDIQNYQQFMDGNPVAITVNGTEYGKIMKTAKNTFQARFNDDGIIDIIVIAP